LSEKILEIEALILNSLINRLTIWLTIKKNILIKKLN
jgi:hypothetical protein